MKIQIYSSRYKPWYEEEKEIPISVNLNDGESFCVRYEYDCEEKQKPFGKWSNNMCCDECEK